jgi:hypothetical protein
VTDDDVFEHRRLLRNDPQFDPNFRQLADFSEITANLVATSTVQETSREHYFSPGTRRAFVARDDAVFGMLRMFELHAESIGQMIEVFRDRHAAEAWLEL